ncbi:MAG TPA: DUF6644 family protein [Gammaproteobacteria bacterium]|nr:DUF6644 family protein [Gammaproteobacteria bacterium]
MGSLYDWMESTPINEVVMYYRWSWPTLETLHFLGLCLLIGAVLIMDLRLIGFQRMIPLPAVHSLMPVALAGFAINLITGLGFLFGDPRLYVVNYAFWVKMVLVVLAGLNFLLFLFKVEPRLARLGPHDATPMSAKAVGTASLVFWFGVLLYGRLLPYLGTGGG